MVLRIEHIWFLQWFSAFRSVMIISIFYALRELVTKITCVKVSLTIMALERSFILWKLYFNFCVRNKSDFKISLLFLATFKLIRNKSNGYFLVQCIILVIWIILWTMSVRLACISSTVVDGWGYLMNMVYDFNSLRKYMWK